MLSFFLVVSLLQAQCPTPQAVLDLEVYKLPAACPSPALVWAYTPVAYADNAAELAGLGVLVSEARSARDKCRKDREEKSKKCEAKSRKNADLIRRLTDKVADQPSRVGWFFIGAGTVAGAAGIVALIVRSR